MKILGIDGRSGSGKSTLAGYMGGRYGAPVVQLDQMCPGWDGLAAAIDHVAEWVLSARPGERKWRRWDWVRDEYAEWVPVPESPLLIVEGCGIGSARARRHLDGLVWVQTPDALRRSRALARELEFAPSAADPLWWWDRWAAQESAVLDRERTPLHATWRLDGRTVPTSR